MGNISNRIFTRWSPYCICRGVVLGITSTNETPSSVPFQSFICFGRSSPAIGVYLGSTPVWMGYGLIYLWLVSSASEQPVEKANALNFEGHAGDWQVGAILDLERIEISCWAYWNSIFIYGDVFDYDGLQNVCARECR